MSDRIQGPNVVKKEYTAPCTDVLVYRTGKVREIVWFNDQTIANNTVLCTLDDVDIPYAQGGVYSWINDLKLIKSSDSTHNTSLSIRKNGNVIYNNSAGTGMWGYFRDTYIAK